MRPVKVFFLVAGGAAIAEFDDSPLNIHIVHPTCVELSGPLYGMAIGAAFRCDADSVNPIEDLRTVGDRHRIGGGEAGAEKQDKQSQADFIHMVLSVFADTALNSVFAL